MDTFVHKKPRLDLAVSGVGCFAGMATHEPETERSDASALIHSGFTESCLLKVRTYIAESCTRLILKTRNEKVHENVALYTYWVDVLFLYRPIHQGIGVNSGGHAPPLL